MIEIKNLGFSYGSKQVLRNISLNLEPGKIYGLLGENGVGKTTLLTLICGLKKVQEGQIFTDGMNPWDRKAALLENQYYLPDDVFPYNCTALDFAKDYGTFWPGFSLDKYLEIMREFETDPAQKMSRMSTGQLKKAHISFALACNTRYLFMDEPTNGLDIPSKAQFRKAITRYTSDESTIVISTHQVRDVENIIDPIIILDRQDVLINASLEEIGSRLFFNYSNTLDPQALYCEQLPGGFIQVGVNATGEESKVNIEALFNAVYKHKELIKELFR